MDIKIGYRLKLYKMNIFEIYYFIKQYINKFDFFEIKIPKKIYNFKKLYYIFLISEILAKEKYSIHLPKNFFHKNIAAIYTRQKILKLLYMHNHNNIIYLILHIPINYDQYYKNELINFLNILPKGYKVLLENEMTEIQNFKYLKKIEELFTELTIEKNFKNIGFCLDLGHLFFGFMKEDIKINILKILNKNFIKNINEIHIHDYNQNTDHLPLKSGYIDIQNLSKFLCNIDFLQSIIIETNIKDQNKDGISQIETIKKYIKKEQTIDYKKY